MIISRSKFVQQPSYQQLSKNVGIFLVPAGSLDMITYTFPLLIVSFFAIYVHASSNGMDMSMDGAMSLSSGSMLSYLHFTPGDTLWFQGWVPQSGGAMLGACIGLFLLALVDRWLAAIRAVVEVVWRERAEIAYKNALNTSTLQSKTQTYDPPPHLSKPHTLAGAISLRTIPPFIPAHDIARGFLHAGQVALAFAFMLTVMTYQASFIFSIVIGLGVGEMIFGRYISVTSSS